MVSAFRLMFIGFRVTPASYALVISFAALVLLSLPASAGPPFVTDDPEPVDYQHYEMYFFSLGTHTAGELNGVAPSCDCNYGGLPNVQLHFQPGMAVAWTHGGSVTLPNRARNKSPGTSGSRRSDDFTPRLHGRCPEGWR